MQGKERSKVLELASFFARNALSYLETEAAIALGGTGKRHQSAKTANPECSQGGPLSKLSTGAKSAHSGQL